VDQSDSHAGFDVVWMHVSDTSYIDRRLWEDGGTLEAGSWVRTLHLVRHGVVRAGLDVRAGIAYGRPRPGVVSPQSYDVEGFLRPTGEASVRRQFAFGTTLGARVFGSAYLAHSPPPLERRIMVSGADPYETFTNPMLRTRGALFVRPDFHYQAPGDANLRGFDPALGGRWAVAVNLEWTKPIVTREQGFVRSVAIETFGDGALVDSLAVPTTSGGSATALGDAGVGLVTAHQVGDLSWTMRFELPLVVSKPTLAADRHAGDGTVAFRWLVSLAPSF
jgi:hypothetical protein